MIKILSFKEQVIDGDIHFNIRFLFNGNEYFATSTNKNVKTLIYKDSSNSEILVEVNHEQSNDINYLIKVLKDYFANFHIDESFSSSFLET